jgi:hypothetical protein
VTATLKPGAVKKTVILKAQDPTIVDEKSKERQTHHFTLQEGSRRSHTVDEKSKERQTHHFTRQEGSRRSHTVDEKSKERQTHHFTLQEGRLQGCVNVELDDLSRLKALKTLKTLKHLRGRLQGCESGTG